MTFKASGFSEGSDMNYRACAASRRSTIINHRSTIRANLSTDDHDANAVIRNELEETKKELALYQTKVAALEAEKTVGRSTSPSASASASAHSTPSRLYLPEITTSRDRTSSSEFSVSSEHKEVINSIHDAASSGDLEWIIINLRISPHSVFTMNQERRTALHIACMNNSLAIAELLIQNGSVVNAVDAAGQTPLHLCSDPDIMNLLCRSGGNTTLRDLHGFNSLFVHTLHSRDDLVKCLLANNADPTHTDPVTQRTALHCAAKVRSYNIILLLLSVCSAKTFVDAQDKDGNTAVHIVLSAFSDAVSLRSQKCAPNRAQGANIQRCLMLLINRGAAVNVKNQLGDTPLHYVCANQNLRATLVTAPIAQILLDMSADANALNNDGCTPLMVAAVQGDWDVCELLVGAGADLNAMCRITSSYLLNNHQYEGSDVKQCKYNEEGMDMDPIATATCTPSDIIPREVLISLYGFISSRQSKVPKRCARRCAECKGMFDHLTPCNAVPETNKEYGYFMNLLGMEVDVVHSSDINTTTTALNNCGHCGRYLCQKCLSRTLVKELLPTFLHSPTTQTTPGIRLPSWIANADSSVSMPLCLPCYDILLRS